MRLRPVHLNSAIAGLFVVGSACFVLGSVPAYALAVGGLGDAITYFVGSIFFTAASYAQLLQASNPSFTEVDAASQYASVSVEFWGARPHDQGWRAAITQFPGTLFFNISTFAALARNASVDQEDHHVWRPDLFGSTLFLAASFFGILAVGRLRSVQLGSLPWWIAWLNMIGSIFFMASALASYVLPSTGGLIDAPVSILGTLLGACCFLAGASLMFPSWKRTVSRSQQPLPTGDNP
jgi:hypothetical protein